MPTVRTQATVPSQALYRSAIEEAAAGGGLMMGRLVAATAMVLHTREKASIDLRQRDALADSVKNLRAHEAALRAQFPKSLLNAFTQSEPGAKTPLLVGGNMDFDQLELMDEWQVEERVTMARAQQSAALVSDASLAELDTLICSALGLKMVSPEHNPLRPEAYINAVKQAVDTTQVPMAMRLEWIAIMGSALGRELRDLYLHMSTRLRKKGVVAVGYAVLQATRGGGGGGGVSARRDEGSDVRPLGATLAARSDGAAPTDQASTENPVDRRAPLHVSGGYEGRKSKRGLESHESVLTLDRLRQLLSGELGGQGGAKLEAFSDQFARNFESDSIPVDRPATGFDATVPAAFEALKEMQQVDHVVQRLAQRQSLGQVQRTPSDSVQPDSVNKAQAPMRGQAKNVAQALSLEVVQLMVENMARDRRLLPPIQQWIRHLEPALSRLALADPRLFTNKQHPARVLVQEVAHHSLAYSSVQTTGFAAFLVDVERSVAHLVRGSDASAESFEVALKGLQNEWTLSAVAAARSREAAVKALEAAEQRNVLAEKIARQIATHPDASNVPSMVIDFLCGPWAQVVAQARIAGGAGSGAADKYQALISALLWSVHPELTHNNSAKLTRLIPMLLGTLRDGLETIHYPPIKVSAFLEAVMGFHQQAFRANQTPLDSPATVPVAAGGRSKVLDDGNPWLAPEEALASNFIDLPDTPADPAPPPLMEAMTPNAAVGDMVKPSLSELPLGTWVELRVNDQWIRTQLTWVSPHGTLFLFTSVLGATQSMTRRSGDKLVAGGNLRIISGQPLFDGALDAVAQQAMRNSVGDISR